VGSGGRLPPPHKCCRRSLATPQRRPRAYFRWERGEDRRAKLRSVLADMKAAGHTPPDPLGGGCRPTARLIPHSVGDPIKDTRPMVSRPPPAFMTSSPVPRAAAAGCLSTLWGYSHSSPPPRPPAPGPGLSPATATTYATLLPAFPPSEAEELLAAAPEAAHQSVAVWDALLTAYCAAGDLPAALDLPAHPPPSPKGGRGEGGGR